MICAYTDIRLPEFQHISVGQMSIFCTPEKRDLPKLVAPSPPKQTCNKELDRALEAQGGDLPTWGSSSPGCNCWRISWAQLVSLRSQAWTDQYCWQQLRPPEIASQEGPGLITFSLQLLGVSFSIWAHLILDDPHQTKQLTRRPYLLTPFKQNYALPEMHLQLGPPVFQRLQLVGFFPGTQEMVIW